MRWRNLPLLLLIASPGWAADGPALSFNRDVRPILSENCFYCHGQDANHRKGELRLDVREQALKPGETGEIAIVPGKPDESALVQRIFSDDKDEQMPPPKAHRVLTPEQKATLKRWIAQGAEYQTHWAFMPPVRPAAPVVQQLPDVTGHPGAPGDRQRPSLAEVVLHVHDDQRARQASDPCRKGRRG